MIDAYVRLFEPEADAVRRGNTTARERRAILYGSVRALRALVLGTSNKTEIIEKKPSADLWSGQSDEEELGFACDEVDRLLYRMVDRRFRRDECVALGFAAPFVDAVHRKVQGSQFKRRLPVIAKLSCRTIDRDFRYARDWGT
jgi:NAD+ synthase